MYIVNSLLYIGSLHKRGNSYRRFEALANLVYRIKGLNSDPFIMAPLISGFQHYYNVGLGIYFFNRKIRKAIRAHPYDIVWVDNKTYLSVKTLHYIKKNCPQTRIVNLLTDDPFGQYRSSWRRIKQTAPMYDCTFVQREVNQQELFKLGAKNVFICYRSYAADYNRPLLLEGDEYKKYHAPVGFVGTYEQERASAIAYLIKNGVNVTVTGDHWPYKAYWDIIKPFYKGPSVYEEDYIKVVNGMDIALHFLRQGNRDAQDSRTFEIPACKVFMLAEYSHVHADLFQDGEEAVFFKTKEELLEKVKYYMLAEDKRKKIAEAGFNRCISSGYAHYHTLKKVLETIVGTNEG